MLAMSMQQHIPVGSLPLQPRKLLQIAVQILQSSDMGARQRYGFKQGSCAAWHEST